MSSIGRASGPQPWDTYSKTETDNLKVSKVSSTDNSIVRFDGTSGAVQNSSVVIDDSGNVGIGTSSPSDKVNINIGANSSSGYGITIQDTAAGTLNVTNGIKFKWNTALAGDIKVVLTNTSSGASALALGTSSDGSSITERMRIDSSGNLLFNSGYGSVATAYGCRAWVNFNGTGTVAIRASGNVSSITDNGTGDYTVNFTTAMSDANYAPVATIRNTVGDESNTLAAIVIYPGSTVTTTSSRLTSGRTHSIAKVDFDLVAVSFFR